MSKDKAKKFKVEITGKNRVKVTNLKTNKVKTFMFDAALISGVFR